MDIFEILRIWVCLARKSEHKTAVKWYNHTLTIIDRRAHERIKVGKDKTKAPTEAQVKSRRIRLRKEYFFESPEDAKKETSKEDYYNHIIFTQRFLRKHKEQKNDRLKQRDNTLKKNDK